jgi:dTDP-4-dehydrorhamnose reductase
VLATILVTGAEGQLGSELVKILSNDYRIIPVDQIDFDITNFKRTMAFVSNVRPNIIIHTAAFTDVDGAEFEQDKAFNVNGIGTKNVAVVAKKIDARLFYISTDYVFDGAKEEPYLETDEPNPINIYGKSKLLGENFVKEELHKFFIIRTAWLYGIGGKNFVKTMLNLAREGRELQVVNDQHGTPTYAVDLARQIKKLLHTELYGVYHSTSQGSCTWYEFALEIFKNPNTQGLKPITIRPVLTSEFPRPARRPKNSVLENYMLKLQGLDIMPPWKESLGNFLNELYIVRGGKQ